MQFWDTSAVIALILDEPYSKQARDALAKDSEIVWWWGTFVECSSALARAFREDRLDSQAQRSCKSALRVLHDSVFEMQPVQEVRERAVRLLGIHPLRAADALQLAAALLWCQEHTQGAGFICFDERLRQAACREGFDV